MKTIIAAIALPSVFATALVGCVDEAAESGESAQYASDPYGPAPSFRPSTCQEIADANPGAHDGDYTLYVQHEPTYRLLVYCADMKSSPKEYLPLPQGEGRNTSMFNSGNKRVVTVYEKVRFDPTTFGVDLGDQRFATSTGTAVVSGTTIASMPFGVGMSCNNAPASSNVDFTGTHFRLAEPMSLFGTDANGTVDFWSTHDGETTNLTGNCGWVAPSKTTHPTSDGEQVDLYLAFFIPNP